MHDAKFRQKCQICGCSFRFGPHIFDGRRISAYELIVCRPCWVGNWNGWSPEWDERLETHLTMRGIPLPERNSKGCYPRGDQ